MIFRFLRNITVGEKIIPFGSVGPLNIPQEKIDILLERGYISPIAAPPLVELGDVWIARAARLESAGIETVEQLLDAEVRTLAKKLKIGIATLGVWQEEARAWMMVNKEGCINC